MGPAVGTGEGWLPLVVHPHDAREPGVAGQPVELVDGEHRGRLGPRGAREPQGDQGDVVGVRRVERAEHGVDQRLGVGAADLDRGRPQRASPSSRLAAAPLEQPVAVEQQPVVAGERVTRASR